VRSLQLALLGLVSLTFATRLPALLHPLPIDDEAIYSVVANEIIDGGKPYLDAVERKPPLLFYTYAAIYSVAGKYNWPALHLVAVLWTLATMAGLYVIGRALFDVPTGLIAALLYTLFQPAVSFKNIQFNGELLMNLPIVWAWAIAFSRGKSRHRPALFLAGLLGCLAFLLKQPAAIASVPLGLYLLLPSYRASRGLTKADSLRHFAIFAAGFWVTLGVAGIVLYQQGILRAALYWTIEDHASPHFFVGRFVRSTLIFVAASLPLLLGAAWSRNLFWQKNRAEWIALVMLAVASAIGAAAGGRFYSHYYIQLLPALALLAAPVFRQFSLGKTASRSGWVLFRVLTPIWLVLTLVVFPLAKWRELSQLRDPSEAGRYLAEHFQPNERLFVWGQAPEIYLEARMRPACRYVATFPLTGYIFGGPIEGLDTHNRILPGAWDNLQQDFARHPPTCIVDVQSSAADHPAEYALADFPILQNLIADKYSPAVRTAEGIIYRRTTR
jgi:4-amino-4-deoxy-L-arabinose transferase-like glycosyltransferase